MHMMKTGLFEKWLKDNVCENKSPRNFKTINNIDIIKISET